MKKLITTSGELPQIRARRLFLDFETTSINPWHNCEALGVAVTYDECPDAYYVPARLSGFNAWLSDTLEHSETWINHNILYDMHVLKNSCGIDPNIKVYDTLTAAKIVDSDRFRYGLKILSQDKEWLGEDISGFSEDFKQYKDWRYIPEEKMCEYACQDVLTNRKLYHFIEGRMYPGGDKINQMEQQITRILYEIEQTGMRLNFLKAFGDADSILIDRLHELNAELQELAEVDWTFRPDNNRDCGMILGTKYNLPVLEWTETTRQPSYGKDALRAYLAMPGAPHKLIKGIAEYRRLHKLWDTFAVPYTTLQVNGYIHPSYNQLIRTARMSCSTPNMQQVSPEAKEYIIPRDGHVLVNIDYSQLEYRIITHYCKDAAAVSAYNADPNTDFHTWIAELCGIKRKRAKNVNFLTSYGGGVGRLADELSKQEEIIKYCYDTDQNLQTYCKDQAKTTMGLYHDKFANLKKTMKQASKQLEDHGYVSNLYGRRRNMKTWVYAKKLKRMVNISYKAFNTACQSSAGDLMKYAMINVHEYVKNTDIKMIGNVHDSLLFDVPYDEMNKIPEIKRIMEQDTAGLSVPLICDVGRSHVNWRDCDNQRISRRIQKHKKRRHIKSSHKKVKTIHQEASKPSLSNVS